MILTQNPVEYSIGKQVAISDAYRVYLCNNGSNQYLLQIASSIEFNGELERAAYVLEELMILSRLLEKEHAESYPDKKLGYDKLFPVLSDSFISSEQGERRINILAFNNIDAIIKMAPLSNLLTRDNLRISLETSGWIMGRLLKLLYFVHRQGISIDIHGNNILIGPDNHSVVVFDWSIAHAYNNPVPVNICKENIMNAAKAVFIAIGGNIETGEYAYGEYNQYVKFLWELTKPIYDSATRAHRDFYEVVDDIFGKGFYPFKAFPL